MRSPTRSSSAPRSRRRCPSPSAGTTAELSLDELKRRFAKFHREHPPQTRIPDTLRGAVLAAMRQGVTPSQLRHHCGLSSKQLEQWKRSRRKLPVEADLAAPVPRVFSVVDDDCEGAPTQDELELRLGGWSVSVRRVD